MQLLYGPLAGRPRVSDVVRAELPRPKAGVEPWAHLPGFTPQQPVPVSERAFASAQAAEPLDAATYASYRDSARPLVIDNGASELRAGFAMRAGAPDLTALAAAQPHVAFDNVVSRFRDRKSNTTFIVAGAEAYSDAQSRGSVRSAFDGDVLTAPDILENVLDYTFLRLGVNAGQDGEGSVQHPIVMTEALCSPSTSRTAVSELLFETYGVPSVAYGLDSLFAAHANGVSNGLVLSSGRSNTTLVPMVKGKGILSSAKRRLSWSGQQASDYLLRLMQLKYPAFPTRVTPLQASWMVQEFCYVYADAADSYEELIGRLSQPDELAREDRVVQFPFTVDEANEKTEEELARAVERKKESGRRLLEQAQKMRLEKLVQKENDLEYYSRLKEWKSKERKTEYLKRLEGEGFDTEQELDNVVKKIEASLKKSRAKELGEDAEEPAEPPSFPLVDIPDHQLDEESIKEKRRQRLLKAGYDARNRAKLEKEEEKRLEAEAARLDAEQRANDPQGWAQRARAEYEDAIARAKERSRQKEMLSDRKSLAAQQRMKTIADLANDKPEGKRKRGRGGGGADADTFGADDADWAVYREIRGGDDSEDEEDESANLARLEARLLEHDPTFTENDTWAAQEARKNRLTTTFLRGYYPPWDPKDVAQAHQLHLNIERARVPEVFWQPSMAGVDQAGIDELCSHIVKGFDLDTHRSLASNIFVTGRHTGYAGFDDRLRRSVQATQSTDIRVRVQRARDPRFDAWRGMALWSGSDEARHSAISRADYDEKGSDYLSEHSFSAALV
ncbi:actin-like ATPase domain-containing protein [Tilletiopsis washingtonensis]|uniref:Actin-like ATPase domain-containing protein n=1 Tax=Tilletiopsis washingtonensis TaxID=58919 RepID=A0A316ZGC2_9BASI|nr:actin-like ATPase domain-containing protein [Tilletiopsis washingtonensis]PWO00089.1 actin-like ATPase domain-containing protein [Tilletiopsis washingtonensis]